MLLTRNNIDEKSCGVYIISNKVDSRIYIGSATKFRRRFLDHQEMLRKGKHHSKHLQAFVDKYGVDKLEFNLVYECSSRSSAYELEQILITKLKPKFNMTHKVFKHMEGVKVSESVKTKVASSSYIRFKEQNYKFVEALIRLSQTITSNKELAKHLSVSESKVCEFKSRGGTFMKKLILEVENTLGLILLKSTTIQTQQASTNSKFIAKYGSVEMFKNELCIALSRLTAGMSKTKACNGLLITPYALTDILRGKSQCVHATELLMKFKEKV